MALERIKISALISVLFPIFAFWYSEKAFRSLSQKDNKFISLAKIANITMWGFFGGIIIILIAILSPFLLQLIFGGTTAGNTNAGNVAILKVGPSIVFNCTPSGAVTISLMCQVYSVLHTLLFISGLIVMGLSAIIGSFGMVAATWILGSYYQDGKFKFSAILYLLPVLYIVGAILVYSECGKIINTKSDSR